MRLWSLHPKYLDAKGLVALWREALLARKVLEGKTKGYRHHPQLERFKHYRRPLTAIDIYLSAVYSEACSRGYSFNQKKFKQRQANARIPVTRGQIRFEFDHLKKKLYKRDRKKYAVFNKLKIPEPHPLFSITPGKVESWEKI